MSESNFLLRCNKSRESPGCVSQKAGLLVMDDEVEFLMFEVEANVERGGGSQPEGRAFCRGDGWQGARYLDKYLIRLTEQRGCVMEVKWVGWGGHRLMGLWLDYE